MTVTQAEKTIRRIMLSTKTTNPRIQIMALTSVYRAIDHAIDQALSHIPAEVRDSCDLR